MAVGQGGTPERGGQTVGQVALNSAWGLSARYASTVAKKLLEDGDPGRAQPTPTLLPSSASSAPPQTSLPPTCTKPPFPRHRPSLPCHARHSLRSPLRHPFAPRSAPRLPTSLRSTSPPASRRPLRRTPSRPVSSVPHPPLPHPRLPQCRPARPAFPQPPSSISNMNTPLLSLTPARVPLPTSPRHARRQAPRSPTAPTSRPRRASPPLPSRHPACRPFF